jgi:hypothetical protein
MSSAALFGFTEPPYWMRILAATSVPLFGNDGANEGVAVVEWVRGVVEVFECRLAEVVTTAAPMIGPGMGRRWQMTPKVGKLAASPDTLRPVKNRGAP